MANNIPFQPMGKSTRINVTTTANTVAVLSDSPANQVRIHNSAATDVFIRFGTNNTEDAVIPTAGTPAYGVTIHNNQTNIFTVPNQASTTATLYVSAIVASGTATIYVTPGEGL